MHILFVILLNYVWYLLSLLKYILQSLTIKIAIFVELPLIHNSIFRIPNNSQYLTVTFMSHYRLLWITVIEILDWNP